MPIANSTKALKISLLIMRPSDQHRDRRGDRYPQHSAPPPDYPWLGYDNLRERGRRYGSRARIFAAVFPSTRHCRAISRPDQAKGRRVEKQKGRIEIRPSHGISPMALEAIFIWP